MQQLCSERTLFACIHLISINAIQQIGVKMGLLKNKLNTQRDEHKTEKKHQKGKKLIVKEHYIHRARLEIK